MTFREEIMGDCILIETKQGEANMREEDVVDIEEIINIEPTKIKAVVEWVSGRVETFYADLKKDKQPPKSFCKKVQELQRFPTVIRVYTQKL